MWIFLSVLFAWNALVWLVLGALFSPVFPGGWGGILVAALLLIAPVFILIQGFRGGLYPSGPARLLALRPFWYAQLFLPLLAIAGLVGLVAGWPLGAAREVGQMAVACAGVVLVGMSIWGYIGTRRLVVRHLDLGFDTLPPELDGMRIVQLADLHVGPHTSRRQLERIADAVQDARPDLIALVGDQVDDFARDVEPLGAALRHLTAPLGVIAVPGNHDVYAGWADVRSGMERLGWTVLVNEAIPLEYRGARFWIAGTGDPAGKGGPGGADESVIPDVERTLERVPRDDFTVALAHNPSLWPELANRGVDLTLSGHTHYGQVAIPRLNWSVASIFLEHAMGTHRSGKATLYISPGTNYWGIPLRIGALPEVTVITLHKGSIQEHPTPKTGRRENQVT